MYNKHDSSVLAEDTDSFIIGDRVWVGGTKSGSIAYIGETLFAPGDWAGIVLDEPIGKNDGSVAGRRYFQCESKKGIFSRLTKLTRQSSTANQTTTMYRSSPSRKFKESPSLCQSASQSLNVSTSSLASISMKQPQIGERVIISSSQGSKTGVLKFIGPTDFADGEWCGVELDSATGKNDGSVNGKRYFECQPKHGLFAPVTKVSRSPANRRSMGVVHKPTGASLNASLRKIGGSRETLASVSSLVSTPASSGNRRSTLVPNRDPIDKLQKEAENLRKERDFERERVIQVASQMDAAESTIANLKHEYTEYKRDMEKAVKDAQDLISRLLQDKDAITTQLDVERRKCEDLLFRFEEESVNKDDFQFANSMYEDKIKQLEKQLSEERKSSQMTTSSQQTEEEISHVITSTSNVTSESDEKTDELNNSIQKSIPVKVEDLQAKTEESEELCEKLCPSQENSKLIEQIDNSKENSTREISFSTKERLQLEDKITYLQSKIETLTEQLNSRNENVCSEDSEVLTGLADHMDKELEKNRSKIEAIHLDGSTLEQDFRTQTLGSQEHIDLSSEKSTQTLEVEVEESKQQNISMKTSEKPRSSEQILFDLKHLYESSRMGARKMELKAENFKDMMNNFNDYITFLKNEQEANVRNKPLEEFQTNNSVNSNDLSDTLKAREKFEVTLDSEFENIKSILRKFTPSTNSSLRNEILKLLLESSSLQEDMSQVQSEKMLQNTETEKHRSVKTSEKNLQEESNDSNKSVDSDMSITQIKTPKPNCEPGNENSQLEISKYEEEKESARVHMDFLNSVIVELQQKNDELKLKIGIMEKEILPKKADDNLDVRKKTAPARKFCDICDEFDSHETEDCPQQGENAVDLPKEFRKERKIPAARAYCENCEVFGHDTKNCEDTETF